MKTFLRSIFFLLLTGTIVWSCKKDENKIYFEGGTAPVLTASSTAAQVLLIGNAANPGITFSWTNPDYRFTTGISSQNVAYTLQVDTTGSNFTNPAMQELSYTNDLSVTLTVKEFNAILTKLDLQENKPHNMEFRLKASLSGAVPVYSNVVKMVVTPYLDVAVPIPPTGQLYITGDAVASDWTNNPPASQKFTKISNTEFTITIALTPGKFYKFLSTLTFWQPQYGGSSATGGDLGYNMGSGSDPSAIPSPAIGGIYKITVNFKTGKYTVVKQ